MTMVAPTSALTAPYDSLRPMLCMGTLDDGRPCRRNLGEIDWSKPTTTGRGCPRCKTRNLVCISATVSA